MESGKTKLSIEVLMKICKLYKVSADWIIFGKVEEKTDDYLENLGRMALPFAEIVYSLDQLEDFNKVREINHHIQGLLEDQREKEYYQGGEEDEE